MSADVAVSGGAGAIASMTSSPLLDGWGEPVEAALGDLQGGAGEWSQRTLGERIRLAGQCLEGVFAAAREWVELSCEHKRIPPESRARAEEVLAGPVSAVRYLLLLIQSLEAIEKYGTPQLPGAPYRDATGRLRVPLFPARGLFDALLFLRLRAEAWMRPEVGPDDLFSETVARLRRPRPGRAPVALVLGAGNVSAIPVTDCLTKIFQDGRVVLLKMSPVNDFLAPVFARALAPLIESNCLRIVCGGGDVGERTIGHRLVSEVHVTGSRETHETIVWGEADERLRRKRAGTPRLEKPVTSELGNVSPWIVAPGRYAEWQLRFQADNVAASIVNNASFNCVATKVIVTAADWPQRERFLDLVERRLRSVPPRQAYYPGAEDRYRRFAGREPEGEPGTLPWTLLRDANADRSPHLFAEESFVCVCAETALTSAEPEAFLDEAVEFVNERLWGTLCATITVPLGFGRRHRSALERALSRLRYGSIGVNHWPALAYSIMTPPWGAFPGASLSDVQSGIGSVHNPFMLRGVEKTILRGIVPPYPRPVWFPTHGNAEAVAWRLLELYRRPSVLRLPGLLVETLCG